MTEGVRHPAETDRKWSRRRRLRGGAGYLCQEYLPQIMRYFPNSSVATIPNAGHWPHSEQPERFMALLFQILRRNGS